MVSDRSVTYSVDVNDRIDDILLYILYYIILYIIVMIKNVMIMNKVSSAKQIDRAVIE
jgi:hypothetical protein